MSMIRKWNKVLLVSLLCLGIAGCESPVACEAVNLEDQRSIYTFAQEKYQRYHSPCLYGKDLRVKGLLKYEGGLYFIYLTDSSKNINGETLKLGVSLNWKKSSSDEQIRQYKLLSGKTVEINGQLVAMITLSPNSIREIK